MHKLNVLLSKNGQEEAKGLTVQGILNDSFINGANKLTKLDRKKLKAVKEQFECMYEKEENYIHSPDDVYEMFKNEYQLIDREYFSVLYLNNKYKVIHKENIFKGSANSTVVAPREIFNRAILSSSVAIVCVHNHPAGDPMPSPEDIEATKRLNECGKLLGIDVLDHIVIGNDKYISMKELDFF